MGWGRLAMALAALALASAAAAAPAPAPRPLAIGYIPVFKGLERAMAGDLSHYTHLNLAFVNPDRKGRILSGDGFACAQNGRAGMLDSAAVRAAAAKAHAAGSKLLLSVGGGVIPACAGDWRALLRRDTRAALVAALVDAAERHGLDGIDVDIEGALLTAIDGDGNFLPFVQALSGALKARGKLLTCATASYEGGMVPFASLPYFDVVGVMSYDAIGPSWGEAGSEHATVEQARKDLRLWLDRGVPKERLALGLPFYGYGFGAYKRNYSFREIRAEFAGAALLTDVIGSRCAGCSYITFNGVPTLIEKARLAGRSAGGIMVWEISQDSEDQMLIRTINEATRNAAE